ncbi:hypothetical protein LRH25_21325 [Ideonella azotifigens]|uniref:Uncharacterized protein n=1 Tax=Ideonella azotifigens TaxID=513160 RepID=A0ABN1K8H5_9BURK|nr:hypothetical protein [Ideonella azotifigens]MCD2342875.1 hypothetical protein [Ideonella azotifigens]
MEKLQTGYLGHFTLRGFSQAQPDGRFEAHFSVTEDDPEADASATGDTGMLYGTEEEAADAGLQAAMTWANENNPDDREGRS